MFAILFAYMYMYLQKQPYQVLTVLIISFPYLHGTNNSLSDPLTVLIGASLSEPHIDRDNVGLAQYSRKVRLSSVKHLHCMYEL